MEHNARSLNPRMLLFGNRSAEQIARAAGLGSEVARAVAELDARPAALYEVRRIFRRRGDRRGPGGRGWLLGPNPWDKGTDVWRSLHTLTTGSRTEMRQRLLDIHRVNGGELDQAGHGPRLVFTRPAAPYPTTEHYLAVAVAGADKERAAFGELWEWVRGLRLPRQLDMFHLNT